MASLSFLIYYRWREGKLRGVKWCVQDNKVNVRVEIPTLLSSNLKAKTFFLCPRTQNYLNTLQCTCFPTAYMDLSGGSWALTCWMQRICIIMYFAYNSSLWISTLHFLQQFCTQYSFLIKCMSGNVCLSLTTTEKVSTTKNILTFLIILISIFFNYCAV